MQVCRGGIDERVDGGKAIHDESALAAKLAGPIQPHVALARSLAVLLACERLGVNRALNAVHFKVPPLHTLDGRHGLCRQMEEAEAEGR